MTDAKTYLDLYHVEVMNKIKNAFVDFNTNLADAEDSGEIEVPEVVVKFGTEDYCRVFAMDAEYFVEPIFNVVRNLDDR